MRFLSWLVTQAAAAAAALRLGGVRAAVPGAIGIAPASAVVDGRGGRGDR